MRRGSSAVGLGLLGLIVLGVASGCARRQMINADVPLRRVVLYRNGVGYFERVGEVDGDSLRFRVLREHVGDFLATLVVIDSRGHARSVSFPSLEPPEVEEGEEAEEDDGLVDVVLELGGGDEHDLTVAYVVETPIWRPSYRVVLDEDQQALLQGWAVVQNLSGEDWTDVRMSVTSGSPLSFRSDLARPVIPRRPLITDTGEVVAAPVHAETALRTLEGERNAEDMDGEPEPMPEMEEEAMPMEAPMGRASASAPPSAPSPRRRASALRSGRGRSRGAVAPNEPMLDARMSGGDYYDADQTVAERTQRQLDAGGLLSSVGELAAGAVHEGVTRYDVSEPVTVPDDGSTMVAIINQTIPGEDALLYRPDSAVPDSSTYPMRVVRLENDTGVLLERGPVAIYQSGALLGQGLLDPLPDGATTSIPFAIERAVAVETSQQSDTVTGRLVKIAGGRLTVEQFSQRSTTYKVRNGLDRDATLYLRHGRMTNWELVDPPEGTEEVEGASLLPLELEAGQSAELEIVERTPTRRVVDLLSDLGAEAVALYLEGPAVDQAAGPVLRQALEHRERLQEIRDQRSRFNTERRELTNAQQEVRSNLYAIRDIARARDLRNRLTQRLSELSERIDALTNQIVELDAERSEMRVRLSESLRDLTLEVEDDE